MVMVMGRHGRGGGVLCDDGRKKKERERESGGIVGMGTAMID